MAGCVRRLTSCGTLSRMGERDYRLVVEGELGPLATRAFDGMAVTAGCGSTCITGPVRDQSELHAVLQRVRDLGLTLVSLAAVEPKPR